MKNVDFKNPAAFIEDDRLPLCQKLENYAGSGIYPFHMPGHKRRIIEELPSDDSASTDLTKSQGNCTWSDGQSIPGLQSGHTQSAGQPIPEFQNSCIQSSGSRAPELIDITEIEGFDNLHHAEGILKKEQEHLAKVFGADQSFFLVNGSTCGLLSAISAAVPRGGTILTARNCHKAVYHAILLRQVRTIYLYPQETACGIQGSISPADVEAALAAHPEISAVLITSPTYDGVVSDVKTIAELAHRHHIPLIVDEAHGAHFGFAPGFPEKALALGADAVIESMHKTLPAYTQSAALHLSGRRIAPERVQKFLSIYQSSSPSYVLMAGLSRCTYFMESCGKQYLTRHYERLLEFYTAMESLQHLQVPILLSKENIQHPRAATLLPVENTLLPQAAALLPEEKRLREGLTAEERGVPVQSSAADFENASGIFDRDISKILIFTGDTGLCGQELYDLLLYRYGLQMEMMSGNSVTALTGLMDTEEGFARLKEALIELDQKFSGSTDPSDRADLSSRSCSGIPRSQSSEDLQAVIRQLYHPPEKRMEIYQADETAQKCVSLAEAEGCISAEFMYLYPPGIPFLVPGEVIPAGFPESVQKLLDAGYALQGLSSLSAETIHIIVNR